MADYKEYNNYSEKDKLAMAIAKLEDIAGSIGGGPEIVELEEGKSSGNLTADDVAKLEDPNTFIKLVNEYGTEKYYRLAQRSRSGNYYMANYTCLYDGMIAWAQFEEVVVTVYTDGSQTSTWNKQSMTYN